MKEWHNNKTVTISQILAILSLFGVLATSWTEHESRISVLESKVDGANQIQRDIHDELIRLNNKFDRLVERRYK